MNAMIPPEAANAFAVHWLQAWNDHDIDAILSHYAPEIVFLSPLAQQRTGNGRVSGLAALREYWSGALNSQPPLRFDLLAVHRGYASMTVLYRNQRGQSVAETFELNGSGKVVRACACYA